jgi:hypothetical protein
MLVQRLIPHGSGLWRRAEGGLAAKRRKGRKNRTEGSGWPTEDTEHFARWSRDALVAVGRGWLAKEMKRDEGVASPSNIRA